MDLFSHVVVGYLLAYGAAGPFAPQYLAAGALAGGLPDADVFFFPLARRFPVLRHHGITHSVFGVTVVAAVGGLLLAPRVAPGSPGAYFAVMELAGLGHMLGDAFTHFSVAPLLPFSERPLELDADRAINFLTLAVSVGSLALLGYERFRVPFDLYVATVDAMAAFYGGYFGLRLLARWRIGAIRSRFPGFTAVAPTPNPLLWMLLYERREGGRLRTGFLRYRLGRGVVEAARSVDVPLDAPPGGAPRPASSEAEALEFSYPIARRTSTVLDRTYHFARASRAAEGGWEVLWYSLEFSAFGRAAGVRVRIAPDGTLRAASAWAPIPGPAS
jgi:membrane-bound metal-dependent hydrolase YbcI (DUF457 family)